MLVIHGGGDGGGGSSLALALIEWDSNSSHLGIRLRGELDTRRLQLLSQLVGVVDHTIVLETVLIVVMVWLIFCEEVARWWRWLSDRRGCGADGGQSNDNAFTHHESDAVFRVGVRVRVLVSLAAVGCPARVRDTNVVTWSWSWWWWWRW